MGSMQPIGPSAWNLAAARHLLNRAGFGIPRALAERLAGMSPEAAVEYLVNYETIPFDFPEPDFIVPVLTFRERKERMRGLSDDERRTQRRKAQREERQAVQQLRGWWLQRMRATPRPLEEKMALFWHGHFATSAQKVKSSKHNYELNQVFRARATGNFKTLTTEVGQSRAMLHYLDNFRSTREKPNENWARELMELFTLGQGQYTEDDIKQSARAFTGWTSEGRDFHFALSKHDPGVKTFLGKTGPFDGWDIIDIIFEQDALSAFICGKLWRFFGAEKTDDAVVSALAKTFRENNYELKPVLRQLFLSQAFYADGVRGTQIKSPTQLVIKLTHDLHLETVPPFAMTQATAALGQNILFPPNVKGWEGNRAWINANTLLLRYNLPVRLYEADERGQRQMMTGGGNNMMMGHQKNTMMAEGMKKPGMAAQPELRARVREKLRTLPMEERQAKRKILRTGSPAQKRALLLDLGITPPTSHNPLQGVFAELSFATAGECIDQCAHALIDVPVSAEQRKTLLTLLDTSDPNDPMTPKDLGVAKQQQLLHMITSMAEYQLC